MAKKITSIFLILSVILTVFSTSVFAAERKTGDVDGNDTVASADALLTLQNSVGKVKLDFSQRDAADVNADSTITAADALLILQYAVGKINTFPAGETMTDRYYSRTDKQYGVTGKDFKEVEQLENATDATELIDKLGTVSDPSDVSGYGVNQNGKLCYNPITREAAKTGAIGKYKSSAKTTGTLSLGDIVLNYSVPTDVTAYDAIPVDYSVYTTGSAKLPLHIEANTFEEAARTDGEALYDSAMPGTAMVDFEYLGYATGTEDTSARPYISAKFDADVQSDSYPSYTSSELTYSSDIPRTDLLWFKFRFTNTGDTILDSEGAGYFIFHTYLYKKDSSGGWAQVCSADNLRKPLFDYLYPGESGEMWINFGDYYKPFDEGEFKIEMQSMLRCPSGSSTSADDGQCVGLSTLYFEISKNGSNKTPDKMSNEFMGYAKRNTWLSKYEEFMNCFDSLYEISSDKNAPTTGTIYIQPADFSESLTLKMVSSSVRSLSSVTIPLNVDTDGVSISLNPGNENYYVLPDGTRTPLIATQTMADMRVNTSMGPDGQSILFNQITDMKEAGVNYFQTTLAAQFCVGSMSGNNSRYHGDAGNFALALIRNYGLKVEGIMSYPYNSATLYSMAKRITSKNYTVDTFFSSKTLENVNAIFAKYAYTRWGDMYYVQSDGTVPIATEDTRGWLDHYNSFMYPISKDTIDAFDSWLEDKYEDISAYNKKHGTHYGSFGDINPLLCDTREDGMHEFTDSTASFRLWTDAMKEFCLYKTVERVNNYTSVLNGAGIENAAINMRLEGSQWCVSGIDPNTTDPYLRRIYYAQIYNSAVPEVIQQSDTVTVASGYSNNNLSPSLVYELSKNSSKQGIASIQLATFNRMRDYAVNYTVGKNCGKLINTEKDAYLAFVDTRTCLFTWFKAVYEGGGIPGVLWQDYTCDGIMTVSQYKEMKFFSQKIKEMLSTEEGAKWATEFDDSGFSGVSGYAGYSDSYVQSVIKNEKRVSEFDKPYKKL